LVTLRPSDYDPVLGQQSSDSAVCTTDSKGGYTMTLASPKGKRYTLQAVNLSQRTRTIVSDIDFSSLGGSNILPMATLHKTGGIKVILSDSSLTQNGYVFIPGTSLQGWMENGSAIIDSVPAETILSVDYDENNEKNGFAILAEHVDVKQGVLTIVAFSGSTHTAKLTLNTTAEGADVAGNVYGFPVLIRLTSDNFTFDEARTDGTDIRFTKPDNTPLPFEIERWNAAARQAEVWVKVDTVYGNDSSHFIVMYWGEPATIIPYNNANVFDTTSGFKGVWHLTEEASGIGAKGLYKDATGRNNGDDFISSTDRSGIIGYGHGFNGKDDYIFINSPVTNFKKGDLTIALWVNIPDSGGTILSKLDSTLRWNSGDESFYFGDGTDAHATGINRTHPSNGTRPSFVGYSDSYNIAAEPVAPNGWHHLAYTWKWNGDSTGTPRYFIDGIEVPLSMDSLLIRVDESPNAVLRIGQPNNNESYAYFKGLMDELEISAVARSADWIKLSYMNQRKENVFIK
jgi:hypothetical protein